MPLDIKLDPYVLDSVLVRDSYLTHYRATGASRAQFIATEFYPTYMADRAPNGSLKISDRFMKEFETELESFRTRASKLNEVQGVILPIEEIVERNNTAYVVRRVCNFTAIQNYMNGQKMPFVEAFRFIRPLITSLASAQTNGIVFNFSVKDLRVTPQHQLMLDATFSWDMNFHPCVIELAKLYFMLITGSLHSKEKPTAKDHGVTIPARLEEIFTEVLSGNEILYGSIDDFYKKIKFVLDLETGNTSAADASRSARLMSFSAKLLFFLVILSMVGLVYGGIVAFRFSNRWATVTPFAETPIVPPSFDFTQIAHTHPRDTGDPICGTFHFNDIYLYYRADWGRPVLARRRIAERALQMPGVVSTDEEIIFIDNVLPSFIHTWVNERREGFIFFTDGLSDNRIYRATLSGSERNKTRISENTALHMVVIGDYLYYSNYDHNHYLYRIDLNDMTERLVLAMPVFTNVSDGDSLFFFSGEPGGPFNLYVLHPDTPTVVRKLAAHTGNLLFFQDEALYFNTPEGHIHRISPEGEPLRIWDDINAHSFARDGNWLIFTEPSHLHPRIIHLRRDETYTLDAIHRLAYIWARNGVLYGLDYVNNAKTHMIQLP